MLNLSSWISGIVDTPDDRLLREQIRAAEAWWRIQRDPDSVVFKTAAGVKLAPQIVRLESDNSASVAESTAGTAPVRKVIIYGIKGHSTIPNTDMKEKYTFIFQNEEYVCVDVISVYGEIQGIFEARG